MLAVIAVPRRFLRIVNNAGKNYADIALVVPIQLSVMLVADDKGFGPYPMRVTA